MIGRIFTVGGFTLLSRLTGFVRDIVLAAMLGAGPVADAFFVALRLPNHFRAIFAEGAFNAAFVPAYARIRAAAAAPIRRSCSPIASSRCCSSSQVVLLAVALVFTPAVIGLLAPGFAEDPGPLRARGRTHPHHVSLSAAGLAGDALRRHPQRARPLRGAGGGADPAQPLDDGDARARARSFRPPGHAAAWGVLIAGVPRGAAGRRRCLAQRACCRRSAGRGSTRR